MKSDNHCNKYVNSEVNKVVDNKHEGRLMKIYIFSKLHNYTSITTEGCNYSCWDIIITCRLSKKLRNDQFFYCLQIFFKMFSNEILPFNDYNHNKSAYRVSRHKFSLDTKPWWKVFYLVFLCVILSFLHTLNFNIF